MSAYGLAPTFPVDIRAAPGSGIIVNRVNGTGVELDLADDARNSDQVSEGIVNLYFTELRARAAVSVTAPLAYDPATGVISYDAPLLASVATSGSASDLTSGTLPAARLPETGITASTYGSSSQIPVITTDVSGRITSISTVAVSGGGGSGGPSNTDGLPEGTTNRYFTNARARGAISATGSLAYDAATGVLSYAAPALAAIATSGSAADLTTGTLPLARLPTSGVAEGTYGSGSQIPVITTDGYGRITSISTVANAGGGGGGGGTGSVNPSGSFAQNDVILANTTDGTSIKSGGQPGPFVRALLSGTAGIAFNSATGAFSLAAPTATVLGGVLAATAAANQFQRGVDTSGAPLFAQPSFGNLSGSVAAGQMPAHTGDVTSSAGSVALTIGANVVGNAKLAQMPAGTIKGNATGATANAADSSLSAFLDLLSATQGAVLYRGSAGWAALTPGSAGQVFTTGGASANPSWTTPAAGGGGNVSTSGTPTSGQLATFTGANTIQGVTALPAANFPALTGDLTTSAGSLATTLANTAVTAGGYSGLHSVTFDAKGRATAAANVALSGDVTTTAGSLATTIAAGVVTYAKLASAAITSAASDIWSNAASKLVSVQALWSALFPQNWGSISGTYTPNLSAFLNAYGTVSGSLTLANPTNVKGGEAGEVLLTMGAANLTISYGSAWKSLGATPTAPTTSGAQCVLSFRVFDASNIVFTLTKVGA